MSGARVTITLPGRRPQVFDLAPGDERIIGRRPLPDEDGIVIDATGVSKRHLSLVVARESVAVTDLDSTYGTFRKGTRIGGVRVADRPETLQIGVAEITIRPPERSDRTAFGHTRLVTIESHRRVLVVLCRDHVVPPSHRGAWVLGDEEISAVFGGTPNAGTISKTIAEIAKSLALEHPSRAIREALIDWAVATREVSVMDIVALDAYLTEKVGGTYEDRVRSFERSTRLRRNLERTQSG
jgi:pSer/pThr/pTyr-binding forkhead associated (FHA) protein